MKITKFEEIEAWQLARELTRKVYNLTNAELIRFLRYAKRSCTEVQSEPYIALEEKYISSNAFQETYELAGRTRAAIRGFIKYLMTYEKRKVINSEP